ncbi:hypothetical protein, partial [Oribacterium sinus]
LVFSLVFKYLDTDSLKTYATIIAKTARTVKACMQKNKGNTEIKCSINTGGKYSNSILWKNLPSYGIVPNDSIA